MTFEEIQKRLASEGFWVNNLCQVEDGSWRASLLKHTPNGTRLYSFGVGAEAPDALRAALAVSLVETGKLSPKRPLKNHAKGSTIDVDSLLAKIGL